MTLGGIPAGEAIDLDQLFVFLERRAPGRSSWSTSRREADVPEFLSGISNGKTNGGPIAALIRNQDARPADYEAIQEIPRPGHGDFTAHVKYGDHQPGGGHLSGRLTAALCIAGGICLQILDRRGICIGGHIASVVGVSDHLFDPVHVEAAQLSALAAMDFPVLNPEAGRRMIAVIEEAKAAGDSVGGVVECAVLGLPPGLGEPIFGGIENRISGLVFGIPAVKAVEFGAGFGAALMRGSEHNDPFYWSGDRVKARSNHHGGILGGITSGMPLLFRAAIKPTPSIGIRQESVGLTVRESVALEISGRHDPCIVPRAVPPVEAAAAIAICDACLEGNL